MTKKIVIFPNDPIKAYYKKGEIKPKYFNPQNFFDEVHIISFCDKEIEEEKVQEIAGKAKLKIYTRESAFFYRKPWLFFKRRNQILKLIKEINPDIIRAYNPFFNSGAITVYCGKKLNIPTVISLHGDYDEIRRLPLKYFRFLNDSSWAILINHLFSIILSKFTEKYCLSNAANIICVSKFLVKYATKYGAKNISVIYNRVDTNQFIPQRDKNNRLIILSVGRVGVQKNQECLIKSIKNLDVDLILIGQPDLNDRGYYRYLQRLVKKMKMNERVKFIESVPNNKINHYYSNADIFAIASRWEGFCVPVLEAMASGLPVVVDDKEPLPEVLGGTGMVVKNTPRAFEQAFKKLISSPKLRKELGEKARKKALELDGKIMEQKEADLYRKLLEGRSKN